VAVFERRQSHVREGITMYAHSTVSRVESTPSLQVRPERRHPVRMALVTWPIVICLGATVAAAACLMGDCGKRAAALARESRVGHTGTVQSVAFRSDGAVLSSVGIDGSIVVWGRTGCIEHPFLPDGPGQVRSAAFSSDNHVLATGNLNEPVALHDLIGRTSRSLDDPVESTNAAACLAFTPDGATLAVGQQDGRISLWDPHTVCKRGALDGHFDFVVALVFSQDGKTMASSAGDRTVRVWDVNQRRERFSIETPARTFGTVSISPDGRLLALGDRVSPLVRVWDLTRGRESESFQGARGAVVAVAFSPDGSTLAAADLQGFVTFWDIASRTIGRNRLEHSGVHSLAFAPDSRALATGGFDGSIQVWDFPVASAE
jgi:WD40 repeat protein